MADLSVCGTNCSMCDCYGNQCTSCNDCEGKVFHAPQGRACAIYACSIQEKNLKSCGECKDAPCEVWLKTRDPRYSDEEFEANIRNRMQALRDFFKGEEGNGRE